MRDADLQKLAEAATPLPWHIHEGDLVTVRHEDVYWAESDSPNAAYIVAACNETPTLLQRIDRLRGLIPCQACWPDGDSCRDVNNAGPLLESEWCGNCRALAADDAAQEATK